MRKKTTAPSSYALSHHFLTNLIKKEILFGVDLDLLSNVSVVWIYNRLQMKSNEKPGKIFYSRTVPYSIRVNPTNVTKFLDTRNGKNGDVHKL